MQIHLNTYGTYLHIKDQMFEIRKRVEGEVQKSHLAAHKVKSIWVNNGVALSANAIQLAMQFNIDVVFLDSSGHPYSRVWHSKLGSTTLIRKEQLKATIGPVALTYTQQWLGAKLDNQIDFVKRLVSHRPQHSDYLDERLERMQRIRESMATIEALHIDTVADQIRGFEGSAGRLYFEVLSSVLPRQYHFKGRSFRPAEDTFNAFLNYAYGILYGRVEKALILAGLDPYLGFLHRDGYNYKSLVYDFIEPFRIFGEEPVFRLFSGKKVRQDHVDELANGCRLNQEGKVLLIERFNQHLEEEKIRYKGRNQSRGNIIQFEAHQFANELINNS
ncbi:MAG: CRISPR-associated endonuclease Cas1 [Saprospiraceae bacterium]|nr:MAG: CRISPR-associated endonuclease Cas1 [Saprospiraceae bacterium]